MLHEQSEIWKGNSSIWQGIEKAISRAFTVSYSVLFILLPLPPQQLVLIHRDRC